MIIGDLQRLDVNCKDDDCTASTVIIPIPPSNAIRRLVLHDEIAWLGTLGTVP
ncbi:hypothetical protein BKA67DRAFT_554229 [Truncatella angustata]|uniref:Uncharacterized protein n=1 Tax=Truncatella angustata TaxID=152316 RepID=A0A9P9A1L2_9PEZI|nr:uncharacterized protein BKA67DRAFT_554229 [Truncatella angustata]KAH6657095.1 hypothetical protein BKA67DRAFT_554229 [Truncatella angustata]